ncbi:hypothetical protein [Thermococcus sp.]
MLKQQIAEINTKIEEIQRKDASSTHTETSENNNKDKTCGIGFVLLLSLIVPVFWSRK